MVTMMPSMLAPAGSENPKSVQRRMFESASLSSKSSFALETNASGDSQARSPPPTSAQLAGARGPATPACAGDDAVTTSTNVPTAAANAAKNCLAAGARAI